MVLLLIKGQISYINDSATFILNLGNRQNWWPKNIFDNLNETSTVF